MVCVCSYWLLNQRPGVLTLIPWSCITSHCVCVSHSNYRESVASVRPSASCRLWSLCACTTALDQLPHHRQTEVNLHLEQFSCAGSDEDEKRVKEETTATLRCIPFHQPASVGPCFLTGTPAKEVAIFAKAY